MQQSLRPKQSRSKVTTPLLALSLALSTPALGAGTPAGTIIRNQASLEYVLGGKPEVIPSPPVETVINPICSVSVIPNGTVSNPGQSITLDPGATGLLRYQVTNTGNLNSTYALSMVNEAQSAFTPQLAIYADTNGNGAVDAGETPVSSVLVGADQSVNLLVRVTTDSGSRGAAYPNLVASCGSGTTGTDGRDADNVSQVVLTNPPALALQKTFSPAEVRPGAETTVNIALSNSGGDSQEAVVTDFLNTPEMRDFVFVSGSARLGGSAATAAVLEYTADGVTWNTTEPQTVAGIRARTPIVTAGGNLTMSFRVRAPRVDATTRRNVATVTSAGQTIESTAPVTIKPEPGIALGPQGNPQALPGGELSANDRQTRDQVVGGQEVCFTHTVQNLGDLPDTITTTAERVTQGANVQLRDMSGNVLSGAFVVTLDPQQTADFQACYTFAPTTATGLEAVLVSKSSKGATDNRTVDQITTVYPNNIGLTKVSNKGEGALVAPGEELTYTLSFTNTLPVPLINVVVRDPLGTVYPPAPAGTTTVQQGTRTSTAGVSAAAVSTQSSKLTAQQTAAGTPVEFISADRGGVLESGAVVWRLGTVQPGEQVNLTVTVRVPVTTVDGSIIRNTFTLSSDELPTPLVSPPATNTVFNPDNFSLVKESNPQTVVFGEEITYIFTVTNNSTTVPLRNVEIKDVLPVGLDYTEGSSGFRPSGSTTTDFTPLEPRIDEATRTYIWVVPVIQPGQSVQVRFRAIVTPEATEQLRNNALARAVASERETQSRPAVVGNKVEPLSFGVNNADIVGYVFIDRNRNGIYDYRFDLPYPKARVILANGRIAVTDTEGRYHFRNVREQTWGLRLDPNSVALPSLQMPQDAGRPGSRLVYVRNLTSIDFPLAPDSGDIAVIRDTTLRVTGGPEDAQKTMQVQKQVFTTPEQGVYRVQLILGNTEPLPGFTLTDPLPQGAQLVDGENVLNFDPLPTGERAVTYRFRWLGDPKGAVTDPTASWRY